MVVFELILLSMASETVISFDVQYLVRLRYGIKACTCVSNKDFIGTKKNIKGGKVREGIVLTYKGVIYSLLRLP